MKVFVTDETNINQTKDSQFLIYGGLIADVEVLPEFHTDVDKLRSEIGFKPGEKFKFNTASRPEGIQLAEATKAKEGLIDLCRKHNFTFIAYLIHHDIIKKQEERFIINSAMNHLFGRFNYYLKETKDFGMVFIDRLPGGSEFSFFEEKFSHGMDQSNGEFIKLEKILFYGSTCINASHLASAIDVVLGSFRYCVNGAKNEIAGKKMLQALLPMFWHKREENHISLREEGLIFRPEVIKSEKYRIEYEVLANELTNLLRD